MNKGGLETRLINYMNYFLSLGHEVSIITSKVSGEIELPKEVHLIKIDLSAYPKFIRHLFFNYKLEKILQENTFDYTLSLERTWTQDNLIAPNTHIGFLIAQNKWWRNPSDMIQLYLDKKSFRNAKNIFACSQMVKEEIVHEYKIDASKIKVVFPPLNTQKFNLQARSNQKEYLEKYNINKSKINFLFVSTSHKRKGLDLLIEIFSKKENEDKHLYIAGSTTLYKQKNIHSLGFVNNTNELYVCVDATLHPAVYEPYGQIISESIACGTRVIVSEKVGAKEIIKNKELGEIIPANDIIAWSDAIAHFERKASIQEEILHPITKELSLENHMSKIIKV